MKVFFITFLLIIFQLKLITAEDNSAPILKKHSAVLDFNKDDGFKLSNKAKKNLGVNFLKLDGNGPWEIPKSALVNVKHSVGVYRKWNDWITMVLVNVLKETDKKVVIESVDLQSEDLIAITGVMFLRMTDADLNSDTVDSCSH